MIGGGPAVLESSLLARKGDAAPAITDESPLVLHFDEHRPDLVDPMPGSEDEQQIKSTGFAGLVNKMLQRVSGWIGRLSTRIRLTGTIAVSVLIVAALWLSSNSNDPLPVQIDSTTEAASAVEADNQGLQLNLITVPDPPIPQSERSNPPNPPTATVALPASTALAFLETSVDQTAAVSPVMANGAAATANASIIPVNVPSGKFAPPVGDVDAAPDIPAKVPKSVSPLPIPKAKPDIAAVPAGGRYAVQLASIAVEKRANQEAFRLQKQLSRILGGHEIGVEKAVVAGKGTMYRLRANGYRTQAEASSVCAQIARLKVDCLALRR